MSGIGPSAMPRLRAELVRTFRAAPPPVRLPDFLGMPEPVWTRDRAARAASLYWVSEDMAAVAHAASIDFPTDVKAEPPSAVGLIVWGAPSTTMSPFGAVTTHGALWWSEHGQIWTCWITSLDPVEISDPVEMYYGDALSPLGATRLLAASWTLMMQPIAVTRSIHRDAPSTGGRPSAPRPPVEVSIINLRPRLRNPTPGQDDTSHEHHVRWIVRGHWRNQAVGEHHAERRLTWVTPHVKGPEGAPIITERVHVWRR